MSGRKVTGTKDFRTLETQFFTSYWTTPANFFSTREMMKNKKNVYLIYTDFNGSPFSVFHPDQFVGETQVFGEFFQ